MKKITVFCFWGFFLGKILFAQVPEMINYQAVARNAEGLLKNTALEVTLGIRQDSVNGSLVWEEKHRVVTNDLGIFTLRIGDTSAVRGDGTLDSFADIDWAGGPYFLQVKLNGEDYGTTGLLSVPYALYARTTDSLKAGSLSVRGTGGEDPESALFEVKRSDGQTVFAVYNEGVRVYVDDQNGKGPRGGFAVGGFGLKKGTGPEYLRVTPDSVRIYISDKNTKGLRGGFAIGGYGPAKGMTREYLRVTDDSTRVYVDESTKSPRGGFAIGGYGLDKGAAKKFLDLTPKNYFIGHETGKNNTIGAYNIFMGYRAGVTNTEGCFNTFLGYMSGYSNIGYDTAVAVLLHGSNNTFIGYKTGYSNIMGDYNTFIGTMAGLSNTKGRQNVFIGYKSGLQNTEGYFNIFMGNLAGMSNTGGSMNVFLGSQAGVANTTGEENIYLGNESGRTIATGFHNTILGAGAVSWGMTYGDTGTGSNNVIIGYESGYKTKNGSGNVFLGYQAGYNEEGSNRLYISNSSTDNPLIYGEFDSAKVQINGDLYYTGDLNHASDRRFKRDLQPIPDVLEKICHLNGYYFYWNENEAGPVPDDGRRQIGLVAQELEKYFPETVTQDKNGYLYVDYLKMTPVLLEALKQQEQVIRGQEKRIEELERTQAEVRQLKEMVRQLSEEIGGRGELQKNK